MHVVRKNQETINRVAMQVIQEKKRSIQESEDSGKQYESRDLLTLLRMFFGPILRRLFFLIADSQIQCCGRSPSRTTYI
jgi:hypothetical protein